jgi:hypothetical protein
MGFWYGILILEVCHIAHSVTIKIFLFLNTTPVLYILPFLTTQVAIFGPVTYK